MCQEDKMTKTLVFDAILDLRKNLDNFIKQNEAESTFMSNQLVNIKKETAPLKTAVMEVNHRT